MLGRARAVTLFGQRLVTELVNVYQPAVPVGTTSSLWAVVPNKPAAPGVRPVYSSTSAAFVDGRRSASTTSESVAEQIEEINRMFAEARDEIESAREDCETVYFNESVLEAKRLTETTLEAWERLLAALSDDERRALQRSMGLKMEQLKAECSGLDELHA